VFFWRARDIFSKYISSYIFKTESYYGLVIFLCLAQFGFAFVNLVSGVANGLRDTKTYALIQVSGNFLVIPVSWFLIWRYQLVGAAASIILVFLIYSIPAYFFIVNHYF